MTESILDSVKETLGVPVDSTGFDSELMIYINSVFSTLNQLGVGPADGFRIESKNNEWGEFLTNNLKMNDVKTYVSLRVKLLFDPPATSFALDAIKEQIQEHAWRLNVTREETDWTAPPEPIDPLVDTTA